MKQHVDRDGVRTVAHPGVRSSVWLLTLALTLMGLAVFFFIRPLMQRTAAVPPESSSPERAANASDPRAAAAPPQAPRQAPAPVREVAIPRDGGDTAAPKAQPAARQPVPPADTAPAAVTEPAADDAAHDPTGIALFPPPGTKPIKQGIVVPDDVELPPGYVRHYQTMDNGRQLPPILMFHPDYHPVDERGEPMALPEDRIVPPEMAPPGMPAEMLEVPDDGAPVPPAPGRRHNESAR